MQLPIRIVYIFYKIDFYRFKKHFRKYIISNRIIILDLNLHHLFNVLQGWVFCKLDKTCVLYFDVVIQVLIS